MDWLVFGPCLAGFIAVSAFVVALKKCWQMRRLRSSSCSKSPLNERMSRYSANGSANLHLKNGLNGTTSPKKRQRRTSGSPGGGVNTMFGALSLGQSDCGLRQRSSVISSPLIMPARFHPPSSVSFATACSVVSPSNERSILWPSRFSPTGKTALQSDVDDAVSIFSSVSQRADRQKGASTSFQATPSIDWSWKLLVSLVMLGNFTTNMAVLYYLLTRG